MKNSASRRFLSRWRTICCKGSSKEDMCTGPAVPLGGSLITVLGGGVIFLILPDMGLIAGIAGPAMIACFSILFSFLIVNTRALHVPLNYRAVKADASGRQGFREKYRSRARMIFPETARLRPCLPTGSVRYLCPVVHRDVHCLIVA